MTPTDATHLAARIRAGELTATEAVEQALQRLQDEPLGAVVHLDPSAVERAAHASGPFAGVPLLVKDLLPWPGMPCRMGSRLFAQHVPDAHVPYTRALEAAGFVCIGKTATSELGLLGSTETVLEGVTRNPWGAELSAGGSSGGAAALVGGGLVPIAHASDGGGSIRGPAALGGAFGFKPSAGRTVAATAAPSPMGDMVSEHCVSRTVRDSIGFLRATAAQPLGPIEEPGSLRVAVYDVDAFGRRASEQTRAALDRTADLLASLGHRIERSDGPALDGLAVSDGFFTLGGAAIEQLMQMMTPMLGRPPGPDELEPFTLALHRWFVAQGPGAVERAAAAVAEQGARMRTFLASCDVALCPTVGGPRPRLGHLAPDLPFDLVLERTRWLAGFTAPHNQAGAPAMSLPLEVDEVGLPIGIQLAASPGQDERLLSLALQLEAARPWWDRVPDPR